MALKATRVTGPHSPPNWNQLPCPEHPSTNTSGSGIVPCRAHVRREIIAACHGLALPAISLISRYDSEHAEVGRTRRPEITGDAAPQGNGHGNAVPLRHGHSADRALLASVAKSRQVARMRLVNCTLAEASCEKFASDAANAGGAVAAVNGDKGERGVNPSGASRPSCGPGRGASRRCRLRSRRGFPALRSFLRAIAGGRIPGG